jgi:hypothetical protein
MPVADVADPAKRSIMKLSTVTVMIQRLQEGGQFFTKGRVTYKVLIIYLIV